MKKIVVVNAGPRKNWNTDTLLNEAAKAIKDNGNEVIWFDLFRLERYTGCISCFGCKKERFKGHCVCRDGLTPVLDAIRESDGLIIGSPNYLSNLTASFRALYERLIFQNLTYQREAPNCNTHMVPVILVATSNGPKEYSLDFMNAYKNTFERFIGPTEVFIAPDTLQIKDYSKTDWKWTYFDAEHKLKRHEEVFPLECKELYNLASKLFK